VGGVRRTGRSSHQGALARRGRRAVGLSDLPHRHYHRTVREYGFTISGELPHWEYENAEQEDGELVVFREGYYMDRAPGSLHGLEPGPTSAVGCVVLMWRTGRGTWVDEPTFDEETVEVPYP
jgi:hypothetical protein